MTPVSLRYRADIDGLRAVAVLLVVLFHAGFRGTPGGFVGVDVFYVISGYLITSLLAGELRAHGTIRLLDFWARRMRRILPAGVLVLCASLVGAAFILPMADVTRAASEMPAAALYFINWRLADRAVDYFATDTDHSLYLQYWSLAIEEQFYAAWPLIVLLVVAVTTRFGGRDGLARVLLWVSIAIALASFAVSLVQTGTNQPYAFFGTFSRAWQLGVGATIALMPSLPLSAVARRMLALAGVAAIAVAGVFFTEGTPYPGVAALLPTFGAAAFIVAGREADIGGFVSGVFASRPAVQIGKWSYSWYLWHWPVLVLGAVYSQATAWTMGLVLLSLLLACITYYVIEQPARYWPALVRSPRRSVIAGLLLSFGAAGFALLGQVTFAKPTITLSSGATLNANDVRDDKVDDCLLSYDDTMQPPCLYGDKASTRRAVLFGDSHAAAWLPALARAAEGNGWSVASRTKASCSSIDVLLENDRLKRPYVECMQWRDGVLAELVRDAPDIIVLTNSSTNAVLDENGKRLKGSARREALAKGETALVDKLLASTDANIVLLRDVPVFGEDPVDCLLANPSNEEACTWPKRDAAYPRGDYAAEPRVTVIDLTDAICPDSTCRAVIGGKVVKRDANHLTASFSESLAPRFAVLFGQR